MDVTPDGHGEQQPKHTPSTPPGPKTVLIFAAACGTVSGYLTHDWQTGAEVFVAIIAFFTPR